MNNMRKSNLNMKKYVEKYIFVKNEKYIVLLIFFIFLEY